MFTALDLPIVLMADIFYRADKIVMTGFFFKGFLSALLDWMKHL